MRNIVLNIPHSSIEGLAEKKYGKWDGEREFHREVRKWTDWFTDYLFIPLDNHNGIVQYKRFNLSRFVIDVERLPNDPLEEIGQGIIYSTFNGFLRTIDKSGYEELIEIYNRYISSFEQVVNTDTLLIDCHSFPSELSDVDICIGYNEDWSKPADDDLEKIVDVLKQQNYKIAFNSPYSNSLTPVKGIKYHSVMIELNKRLYMNENDISLEGNWHVLKAAIERIYTILLNS